MAFHEANSVKRPVSRLGSVHCDRSIIPYELTLRLASINAQNSCLLEGRISLLQSFRSNTCLHNYSIDVEQVSSMLQKVFLLSSRKATSSFSLVFMTMGPPYVTGSLRGFLKTAGTYPLTRRYLYRQREPLACCQWLPLHQDRIFRYPAV